MSTQHPTAPAAQEPSEKPVTSSDLRKQFRWQDLAVVLAILGGFLGGYVHLVGEARAQADAGISPLKVRVEALETEQKQVRLDVREVQLDVRELYRVIRDGRRSERLEAPPVTQDGGR